MVESIAELRNICQSIDKEKGKSSLSVVFARKISIYFTKLFLYTNISANQVTLLSIVVGTSGSVIMAIGNPGTILVGALILELFYILDHSDGEVARYRKTTSKTGIYLDYIGHYIVHPSMLFCLAYGSFRLFSADLFVPLGYLCAFSIIMIDLSRDSSYKAVFKLATFSENRKKIGIEIKSARQINLNSEGQVKENKIVKLLMVVVSYFRVPLILHVILAVALVNLFTPVFMLFNYPFTFVGLFLVIYSLLSTIIWVGLVFYYKKIKLTENLFDELVFNREYFIE